MSSLATGRVIFKLDNSALVEKRYSSLFSNFILNLYTVYKLNNRLRNPTNNFSLKRFLFHTGKLVRNAITSKSTYNGRGISFHGEGSWSFGIGFARCVVIFGVDNSSSSHNDNQKNNFLVLGEGPADDINDSTVAAE